MPPYRMSRPRRRRALVLLTALTAAVALVLPTTGAVAGKPGAEPPPPAASKITITPVTNIPSLPEASGTPDVLIDTESAFDVSVTLVDGIYSRRNDTHLVITASNGGLSGGTRTFVPAGDSTATFSGLHLGVANGVELTVTPVDRKAARDLGAGISAPFDVVTDTELIDVPVGEREDSLLITKTGDGVPCQPTPTVTTCVDVLLPNGVGSNVFFSTGTCTGSIGCRAADRTVLQVLADLVTLPGSADQRYPNEAPATLVVKCDKTLCGGGAIRQNTLQASLEPSGPLREAPSCSRKGVVDVGLDHCVDYVQSKRDGSGDTYLYWLVTRDARFSI